MKELSIEEKARRYDEAIERAKGVIEQNPLMEYLKKGIEYIFPELKESEDERIRKALLNYIYDVHDDDEERARWIAWLEKQGEQNPAEYTLEQAAGIFLDALSNTPYNNKPITDAQVITKELLKFLADTSSYNPNAINEQKSAEWSEVNEIALGDALWCCKQAASIAKDENDMGNVWYAETWLKSLKDRVQPQPKQGWSEEDNRRLNKIEIILRHSISSSSEDISWLKSLRPQSQWKPSKEQLQALRWVCNRTFIAQEPQKESALEDLYEQLKAL